eukprot:TRINITY_DN9236_c0_g1_i1.p1 TRINITY_DN9236_c0_g1~~TRINITY_DN9236_c0_g1_i1.p1  ORF type:complete len:969 (+),score=242.63 TRINITY_DN9236_c0_g1_i1:73-2907(+)
MSSQPPNRYYQDPNSGYQGQPQGYQSGPPGGYHSGPPPSRGPSNYGAGNYPQSGYAPMYDGPQGPPPQFMPQGPPGAPPYGYYDDPRQDNYQRREYQDRRPYRGRGGRGGFRGSDRGGFRAPRGSFRGTRGGFRGNRGAFRGDRGGRSFSFPREPERHMFQKNSELAINSIDLHVGNLQVQHYVIQNLESVSRKKMERIVVRTIREAFGSYSKEPDFKLILIDGNSFFIKGEDCSYLNDYTCEIPFIKGQVLRPKIAFKSMINEVDSVEDQVIHEQILNLIINKALQSTDLVKIGKSYVTSRKEERDEFFIHTQYKTQVCKLKTGYSLFIVPQPKIIPRDHLGALANYGDISNFRNLEVLIPHLNKTVLIHDRDMEKTAGHEQFDYNGKMTSICEYYNIKYNMTIDPNEGLLFVKGKDREGNPKFTYYPLSVCYLTNTPESMRHRITKMTQLHPIEFMNKVEAFLKLITEISTRRNGKAFDNSPIEIIQSWGIALEPHISNCRRIRQPDTKVLPSIYLKIGAEAKAVAGSDDWGKELQRIHYKNPRTMNNWIVIRICSSNEGEAKTMEILRNFDSIAKLYVGHMMARPVTREINAANLGAFLENECVNFDCILVIAENGDAEPYRVLKRFCSVNNIVSQYVNAEKHRNLKVVCSNLIAQLQVKMGASIWDINWATELRNNLSRVSTPFLVIGSDIYNSLTTTRSIFVVSAMYVGEGEHNLEFWSDFRLVDKTDCSSEFSELSIDCMNYFRGQGKSPASVIVYRGGIPTVAYEDIVIQDCTTLKESFLNSGINTSLTYCVVHNQTPLRMFWPHDGNYFNPPTGTFALGDICRSTDDILLGSNVSSGEVFDFYLHSCKPISRNSMAKPVHYIVIFNDNAFLRDQFIHLTFLLTHLYFTKPGSLKYPAPMQNALKYSKFVGETLMESDLQSPRDLVHNDLASKLHFL